MIARQKCTSFISIIKRDLSIVAVSNAAAAVNYLFSIYLSRTLSKLDLSAYYAVAALGPLTLFVFSSLPQGVPRVVLNAKDSLELQASTLSYMYRMVVQLAGAVFLFFLVGGGFFSWVTKVDSYLVFWVFGGLSFFSIILSFYTGVLLLREQYLLGAVKDLVVSLFKVVTVFIMFNLVDSSYFYGFVGELFAVLGVALLMRAIVIGNLRVGDDSNSPLFEWAKFLETWKGLLPLIVMNVFLAMFLGGDILLVRREFLDASSGIYAGISVVAKIAFFVPGVLGSLLVPKIVHSVRSKESPEKHLISGLMISVSIGLALGVTSFFMRAEMINVILGPSFEQGKDSLWMLIGIFSLCSILGMLHSAFFALGYYRPIYLSALLGGLSLVGIDLMSFEAINSFCKVLGISVAIIFLINAAYMALVYKRDLRT